MNKLAEINQHRRREIEAFRDQHVAAHRDKFVPKLDDYPLPKVKRRVADALSERWGQGRLIPQFELIERDQYDGDIALKFPQLLRDSAPKVFIQKHLPWIVEVLSGPGLADVVARIETKGMYINITFSDRWLLNSAQAVADVGDAFGRNDSHCERTFVVDYSSPNVAKMLHAGHIRSTIIGHVLSNLYEACGACVYRINHINDFGGFGFTLEGYRRFEEQFPKQMSANERLLEIYRIRRTAERIVENSTSFGGLTADERDLLARYFPDVGNTEELTAHYREFVAASDARFAALEAGDAEEVELWQRMVAWSLADFEQFYDALNIHFDLIIGESFYVEAGQALVDACLAAGTAVIYTRALADGDLCALDGKRADGELTQAECDSRARLIRKDIGAVVVLLGNGERYVVRRADGRSIYATRDLGAIKLRCEIFDPTDMIYVVGQEQQLHFDRLFRAAYNVALASPERRRFQHLYFGFYVNAKTGKKLSSRDTVANVNHLLAASFAHFRSRLSDRTEQTEEEFDRAARELAVGSLVFNDLKQDMKAAVEIDAAALEATIAAFEKSGGAYMVYSACRARSILRKHGRKPVPAEQIDDFEIDDQEAVLLLKLQQIPEKIVAAANQSNPAVLVRHLLDTAAIYNSYYMRAPVISGGVAKPSRLVITQAVQQALVSSLRLCHVECPEAI